MAEVFLLPVAIKLASFAGKCSEMEKKAKAVILWSIADHFEAIKNFHFTVPLMVTSLMPVFTQPALRAGNKLLKIEKGHMIAGNLFACLCPVHALVRVL